MSTFADFQAEMIRVAQDRLGDHYPGDAYYEQECWREEYESGDTAEQTVISDSEYFKPPKPPAASTRPRRPLTPRGATRGRSRRGA